MRSTRMTSFAIFFVMCFLAAAPARADIITTNDNRQIKGIVTQAPETEDRIVVQTARGTITIMRSRIKEIKQESKSEGYVQIGRELMQLKQFPAAINAFQQALQADPANSDAQSALDEAQMKLDEKRKVTREQAIVKIDDLRQQAGKLIEAGKFEEAEQMLVEASKLVPTPEQRRTIKELISNLYLAWGDARQDKLDPVGAEEKYNLAVTANQQNEAAINKLLLLWESNPQKKDQVARIYEQMIQNNPNDQNLRLKLAELYYDLGKFDDSAHHYLELYKSNEQYRGSRVEERLITVLDKLHLQNAKEKDYDKAIEFYKLLMMIDPQTDPAGEIYYQYLKRANELKPDDNEARMQLAQFAENNGLEKEAIQSYKQLAGKEKFRTPAQAGLDRYAERRMLDAEAQFKAGNYQLASTLATQVRADFPNSQNVSRRITELINIATAQIQMEQQTRSDRAEALIEDANEFKRQGDAAFNQIFYTQHENIPYLSSPRQEAIRYYNLALQTYQEAMRINPSMASNPNSVIAVRMQECQTRIVRLTSQPLGRQNFGPRIGIPPSSIPPMQR